MKPASLGLDLGTSNIKGAAIASNGRILALEKAPVRFIPGEEGRAEFDAQTLESSVFEVLRSLAASLPEGYEPVALSIASAGGDTLLLDDAGTPAGPAVSWLDRRAAAKTPAPLKGLDFERVRARVGWPYLGQFPLATLGWLRERNPELLGRASRIGSSTSYILMRLTGRWALDSSTATTLYLRDQETGLPIEEYLAALEIEASQLPEFLPSGETLAELSKDAAAKSGLPEGLQVVMGSFDHPAAARRTGIFRPEQLLVSCGTSWVGFLCSSDRGWSLRNELLCDPYLSAASGPGGAMFSTPGIGRAVEQVALAVGGYQRMDALAGSVPRGSNGLSLSLFEQAWQLEESVRKRPADACRAVMESAAFHLKEGTERLAGAGRHFSSASLTGGPSASGVWRRILAEALGIPVIVGAGAYAGAFGAAMMAGAKAGVFQSLQEAFRTCSASDMLIQATDDAIQEYSETRERWKSQLPSKCET